MNKRLKQIILWSILLIILLDFTNSLMYFFKYKMFGSYKALFYLSAHLPFIFLFIFLFVKDLRNEEGLLKTILNKIALSKIPKNMKYIVMVVFFGNLISIGLGKPLYPFYDVGMFRWQTKFDKESKTVYLTKYYYYKNGEYKILDLRKESFLFFSEHFDITFSHIFTFSANFHNKSRQETFDYLIEKLKVDGIDTLWVGLQSVNYETGLVKFETDKCKAIKFNNDNLHYGPLFIPNYQLEKCEKQ